MDTLEFNRLPDDISKEMEDMRELHMRMVIEACMVPSVYFMSTEGLIDECERLLAEEETE